MANRRKPMDLKILNNTYRADRDGPKVQATAPGFGNVAPPDDLNAVGQRAWSQTILLLMKSQSLSAADRDAIHQYAQCHQRKAAYDAALADGEIVTLPNGIQTIRPEVKLRAACERQLRDFQRRFGFDPTSRNQLSIKAGSASMNGPYNYLELSKLCPVDPTTITHDMRERLIETKWFGMSEDVKRLAGAILESDPVHQAQEAERLNPKPKGLPTRNRNVPPNHPDAMKFVYKSADQ